jgi:hypothetical protein
MEGAITGAGSGTWTEDKKIQYFISAYATAFSHPALEAFNQWGIGPDTNRWTMNYLLQGTGQEKPSYAAIKSLVRDKFMTKASGNTDGSGIYAYRGFKGTYDVTVEKDGLTGTTRITLGDAALNKVLKVVPGTGSLTIEGGDAVNVPFQNAGSQGLRYQGPKILAAAGQAVVFTGLREVRSLQILDLKGRVIRSWDVFGDRIEWDRADASGRTVGNGKYAVRGVSLDGKAFGQTLTID